MVAVDRLFTLSTFEALRLIRRYELDNPGLQLDDLIRLIETVEADGRHLDTAAAAHLHVIVDGQCSLDNPQFYQQCIKAIVLERQPIWMKAMRQGRMRFISSLAGDDMDVFGAAGLMLDPPPDSVVAWWDQVVGHARLAIDVQKMEQARIAERLSIQFEAARLRELDIDAQPEWTGLDDNFAGYDVKSFDLDGGAVTTIMIEVKSTTANPLRFFLTRNEWRQAETVGDAYRFHVWDMSKDPPVLHVRSVSQVRPHIPVDSNKGRWSVSEIPLGGD